MRKPLLWVIVLVMSMSLAAVFSSGGCRSEVLPVEESVVEEVTSEPEEEVAKEAAPSEEEKPSEEDEKLEVVGITEVKKIKSEIKTEVEGEIVKYQEESFYPEDGFLVILENEDEFKSQLIEKFKKEIIEAEALNCKADLNQLAKSAILKCDIKGARYSTDSYSMHFLLNGTKRFGFDLYGFDPKEPPYGKKLTFDGEINGIPTKITFEFPYELSHCHEHVWPE
jgi:hypothetical protein